MQTAFCFLKFLAKFPNITTANDRARRANHTLCLRTSGSLSVDGDNRRHNESQSAPSKDTVGAVAVTTLCLAAQNTPTPPPQKQKKKKMFSRSLSPRVQDPSPLICDNPQIVQ